MESDSNTPKKRGRKPKIKTNEIKIPKKRGRKPKNIIKNIDESAHTVLNTINNDWNNNDNLIIHLKINNSKDNLHENIEPIAYDSEEQYSLIKNLDKNDQSIKDYQDNNYFQKNTNIECNNDIKSKKFLKKYNETVISKTEYDTFINFVYSDDNIWPIQTDIYCMWCVHSFDNIPCGIPTKYYNEKFYLKGCFCSFNCAAKYIFDKNEYNKWEQYALLNLLYNKIYKKSNQIKLAHDREILKIFGGFLDINEFRDTFVNINIDYKVNLPPLVAVVPKIEETKKNINYSSDINYDLFNNTENTTLTDNISYLNSSMNIKIKKN